MRGVLGSAALLAGLCAGLATSVAYAATPTTTLSVGRRQPLAFLLGTPTGEGGRTSSSELIRMVSDLLRARTNLEIELLDASLMRTCRGRLTCLTLKARPDYVRKNLLRADGSPLPFREHVRRLRDDDRRYAKYLLVLSNVTLAGQPDRLSAVLVNTDLALSYYHEANRDAADWEDATEAKINVAAVVTPPARAAVADPEAAGKFIDELFEARFVTAFEATGNWAPYGQLELQGTLPEGVVYLDDRPLGSSQPDRTLVDKVDPGFHQIRIEQPGYRPFSVETRARRGALTAVPIALERLPDETGTLAKQFTLWGGVAMVAAGVGLSIYGATVPQSNLQTACIESSASACSGGPRFVTFGYDAEQAALDPRQINPKGVMIVPLGYSLAGAGAAFSLGSYLTDDADLPWLSWVAGLAVGALAYGVSAAVAGP